MATPCVKDDTASILELCSFLRGSRYGDFFGHCRKPSALLIVKKDTEVKASMDNGVLIVTFPKTTPEMAPKKVQIA